MNLHEYQAKILFDQYGIPVPPGKPARSVAEAVECASAFPNGPWLIKAQIHAGGRGKAGGVKFTREFEEIEPLARAMLGTRLVTRQSGPEGQPIHAVLIAEAVEISHEYYLAMTVDRARRQIALLLSAAGGMDIEEIAVNSPEQILSLPIDPTLGLMDHHVRRAGFFLGLDGERRKQLGAILKGLYRLFIEKDASLIEINPLALTTAGQLIALDAKLNIDDNALYRQAIAEWRDPEQEDVKERLAKTHDLSYVTLEGEIGCMVNGAGLAMATMDIIALAGGRPANFLDVGGGATAERVAEAFRLISLDPRVKSILVNIFGGIVRCDLIAEGIIQAVKKLDLHHPIVVRLAGNNEEAGKAALATSGLKLLHAADLRDAAEKAVAAAKGGNT